MLDLTDENLFRIQDFTSVTPLEQLAKKVSRCLLIWKGKSVFSSSFSSEGSHCSREVLSITEESILYSNVVYHLTFFHTSDHETQEHTFRFYAGKVHPLQRWFGVTRALTISMPSKPSQLSLSESKLLLDALTLGCQESSLHLPCFVLVNEKDGNYIGQWITTPPLTGSFRVYHYESLNKETDTFSGFRQENALTHFKGDEASNVLHRLDFFHFFCHKIGMKYELDQDDPHAIQSPSGCFYAGFRYVFYVDQFPPVTNSFWISLTQEMLDCPTKFSVYQAARKIVLDPITQFHLICTWEPRETLVHHLSRSLDAWNPSECVWSLRVVGSQDRSNEEMDTMLTVSTTFKKLLSSFQHSQESLKNYSKIENIAFSNQITTSVKYLTSEISQRLPIIFPNSDEDDLDEELRYEQLIKYVFDLTTTRECKDNLLYDITNCFIFRLTRAFEKIGQVLSLGIVRRACPHKRPPELREHWENKILIPHVTPQTPCATVGLPLPSEPPLLQQLKVINCCIQQYHVFSSLKSKDPKSLVCPVFPPIHSQTYRFKSQSSSTDPLKLMKVLMSYFLSAHPELSNQSPSQSYTAFVTWVKSFTDLSALMNNPFTVLENSKQRHSDSPFINPIHHDENFLKRLYFKSFQKRQTYELHEMYSSLFQPEIEAETVFDCLTYLTEQEISRQILYCFIYLVIQRWERVNQPSQYLSNLWTQWLEAITLWKKTQDSNDILPHYLDWNLMDCFPLIETISHNQKILCCNQSQLQLKQNYSERDILQLMEDAMRQLELGLLYEESLKQKFFYLPSFNVIHSLLCDMDKNEETILTDPILKKAVLNLFFVEQNEAPGVTCYSPLPLFPMNMEYIFAYHPGSRQGCYHQNPLSNPQARVAYFSQMSNHLRIAFTNHIF